MHVLGGPSGAGPVGEDAQGLEMAQHHQIRRGAAGHWEVSTDAAGSEHVAQGPRLLAQHADLPRGRENVRREEGDGAVLPAVPVCVHEGHAGVIERAEVHARAEQRARRD